MIDKVKFLKKIYYMNMKKYIAIAIVVIFLSAIPLAMHSSAGSNSNNIPYATSYNATINEKGLPSGTTWSFALGTHIYTTSNSSYSIPLADGTYGLGVNSVYTYPITINSPPSGTGYYQQLLTINNPSQYGINTAGSNIQFTASNGTLLYAWIQSINSTSMQVWVKNFNGSSQINMKVFPEFENLFSATGYLGEAPQLSPTYGQYFNAPLVFGNKTSPNAWDFSGTTLPSQWKFVGGSPSQYFTQNNGATVHIGNKNGTDGVGLASNFTTFQNYLLFGIVSIAPLSSSSGDTAGLGVGSATTYGVGYGSNNAYEGSSIFSAQHFPGGLYTAGTPYSLISGTYTQIPDTPYNGTIGEGYTGKSSMLLYNNANGFAYYNFDSGAYTSNQTFPLSYNFGIWNNAHNQTITAYTLFLVQSPNGQMPTISIGAGIALDSGLLKEYKVSNSQYVTINGGNASGTVNFIHDRYNLTVKSDIPNRFNVYNSTSSFTNNFTAHTYSNMLYNYSYKGVGLINGTGGNYYNITGNINVTHNMTLYINYTKFNDKIIIYLTGNNVTITLFFNENFMKYDNYTMYTYNRLVINITNYNYYPAVLMANSPNGYTLSQSAMSFNSPGNYTEHLYVTTFNNNNAIDFAEANSGYIVIAMIMLGIILLPLIVRRGAGR